MAPWLRSSHLLGVTSLWFASQLGCEVRHNDTSSKFRGTGEPELISIAPVQLFFFGLSAAAPFLQ